MSDNDKIEWAALIAVALLLAVAFGCALAAISGVTP